MHKIEEIKALKCRLMNIANMAVDNAESVDTKELGEVIDMIKDLAEAEEKCIKAKYYEALVCTMDEASEVIDGMDPEDVEMMYADLMHNGPRGYTPHRSSRTGRFMSNSSFNRSHGNHMRGYPMDDRMDPNEKTFDPEGNPVNSERFGRPYNNYRNMRRNYTESHSPEDKKMMDKYAKEHLDDATSTMKDIWNGADPEMRKKMKADLTALLASMN